MTKTQTTTTYLLICLYILNLNTSYATEITKIESLFEMTVDQLLATQVSVASRSKLSLSDAPASISIYTSSDIKLMGIEHLDQLLNFVPGFLSAREDQTKLNASAIRGRRVNNNNPDILVILDGMPINDPVTGGGLYNISELSGV